MTLGQRPFFSHSSTSVMPVTQDHFYSIHASLDNTIPKVYYAFNTLSYNTKPYNSGHLQNRFYLQERRINRDI